MGCVYRRTVKHEDGTTKQLPTWWIKYSRNGKPHFESAHSKRKEEATRLLRLREGDIARGLPVTARVGRMLFDEAAQDVVTEYRINGLRSLSELEGRLRKHLSPFFAGRRMSALTTADVRRYTAERLQAGAANSTVNRELAIVKRAFMLALQSEKLLTRPHIPMLKECNVRTGFFERDQLNGVIAHVPEVLHGMLLFSYLTGWRIPSEVLTIEWRQVDFEAGTVRLEVGTTKNEGGREFPFDVLPELHNVLQQQRVYTRDVERQRDQIVPWVFHRNGKRIRDFRKAWMSACGSAGCPGKIPHDFRRSAVRNLIRAGVSDKVAMQLTGHKTRSVFDRYDIVSGADLREGVRKLATVTKAVTQGQSGRSGRILKSR